MNHVTCWTQKTFPQCTDESIESTIYQDLYESSKPKPFDTPTFRNHEKITKNIPKFKGGPDDHFESLIANVDLYLRSQCSALTENQKLKAVLLKIEGYPRMILQGTKNNLNNFQGA